MLNPSASRLHYVIVTAGTLLQPRQAPILETKGDSRNVQRNPIKEQTIMQTVNMQHKRILVITTAIISVICTAPCSFAGNFAQQHPRRAEVHARTSNLNSRINKDKGDLGGNYGQLKKEDSSIHRQERRDSRVNGGFITKGQKAQLNKEENGVSRQIKQDRQ
jgi:hypothetical protein